MAAMGPLSRTPFSFLVVSPSVANRVACYVLREHARGRSLLDVLGDDYVCRRLGPRQRRRLLDRPELVHALADDGIALLRMGLGEGDRESASGAGRGVDS